MKQKIKTKKGLEFGFHEMLIAVIGFVVLMVILTSLLTKVDCWSLRETCRISAYSETTSRKLSIKGTSKLNLVCPRFEVNFENKKTEIIYWNSLNERQQNSAIPIIGDLFRKKTCNEDEAKEKEDYYRIMAEQMRGCWYQFLEGKSDIFDKNTFAIFQDDKTFCFVCSEINFNKQTPKLKYSELNNFLKETEMKGDSRTYMQFLSSAEESLSEVDYEAFTLLFEQSNFSNTQQYYTVFMKKGNNVKYKIGPHIIGVGLGTISGVLFTPFIGSLIGLGADEITDRIISYFEQDFMGVYVLEKDSFANFCDVYVQ